MTALPLIVTTPLSDYLIITGEFGLASMDIAITNTIRVGVSSLLSGDFFDNMYALNFGWF